MRLLVAFALTLGAAAAHADDLQGARDHFQKGTRAYELGLYDEAIREYTDAYKSKDDPAILYNIAQAHRLAEHHAEALRFYRMYLLKVPDPPNRKEVNAKIEALQKLIEQQKKAHQMAPSATMNAAIPTATHRPDAEKPLEETARPPPPAPAVAPASPTPPPREARAGRTKIIAGAAVAAFGVAALATGVAFAVLAKNAADELTQLDDMRGTFDPAKERAGKLDDILGGVFLGVGGAAAVAGAVLIGIGASEKKKQGFAFAPILGNQYSGAAFEMSFQ